MLFSTARLRSVTRASVAPASVARGIGFLLLPIVMATGCGSNSPFDYVKVSGKVLYDDGTPVPFSGETRIMFGSFAPPADGDAHPRPAVAYLKADGTFESVTSYKYGDGLVRGKHKVLLSGADAGGKPLFPIEYADINTTPAEIDTADSPLEIKIPKPTE